MEEMVTKEEFKISEESLKSTLDNMREGCQIISPEWRYLYINAVAANHGHSTVEKLLGKTMMEMYPNIEKTPMFSELEKCMKDRIPIVMENQFAYQNGTKGWFELSIQPVPEGILLFSVDITNRKKTEEQLIESEKKYREAYEQVNFYRDLFTHDINNILQNIISSVDLCFHSMESFEQPQKTRDILNIIKGQVIRGGNLVKNIQTISQLDNLNTPLKIMNLTDKINESIKYIQRRFVTKPLKILTDFPKKAPLIRANELLLDVFEIILANAVLYNEKPIIEIIVKTTQLELDGHQFIRIEFKDNGWGIEDVRKKLIFQEGHHEKKRQSGMGLGLSLVKKVLDSYNGQIWVEDIISGDPSKGSNFIIQIQEANHDI